MVKKSLRELSAPIEGNPVCNYSNEFIDFDESKGKLGKKFSPMSPDMLYINDEIKQIWFVEFKARSKKSLDNVKDKKELKQKLFGGLFMLYELFCDKCKQYKNYEKYYFVVYNKESSSSFENEVLDNFDSNSERTIEFSLDELKPTFVKDVFTENCMEFKRLFEQKFGFEFRK
jgi:hypothetical protein